MASKHPKETQINRSSGVRTYVSQGGSYIQRMRGNVDRSIEYALNAYKSFMKHSEFKKPYMATNYNDMEYETPPIPTPPGPGPNPPTPPGPTPPPPPGPTPPGPTPPGPTPYPPIPPPWWNDIWFCDIAPFWFCPGGYPEAIPINTNDQISSITLQSGGGSISGRSYIPGGGSGSVTVHATTAHGADCSGSGWAKDPSECPTCGSPSIGYTTTQMSINETQQLTVVGGGGGPYTWSLSGGGSISSSGLYTAPGSNANCSNNPTISLICRGQTMATLSIAVNGYVDLTAAAYRQKGLCKVTGSVGSCVCNCGQTDEIHGYTNRNCVGTFLGYSPYACTGSTYSCGVEELGQDCTTSSCPMYVDVRTPDMITNGCCPEAL